MVLALLTSLLGALLVGELRYRSLRSGLRAARPKRRTDAAVARAAPGTWLLAGRKSGA
jgi:hypothetical protein